MLEVDRALAALLMLVGCGDAVERPHEADSGAHEEHASSLVVRWVGVVEETDVRVAALVGAGQSRLYFCGGADSYLTATHWFDIAFNSEHLEYQDELWRIHAHLTSGAVVGEIERAGDGVRMFNARAFGRGTIAGLYEGKAACGHVGMIVTQPTESDEPTAQGACVSAAGAAPQRVHALTPIKLQDGKLMVQTADDGNVLLQTATLESF